ncbi:30S ribosomal protein S8 [Candidatus Pacearchaeota archaeon]|nr:30S ribosomal protein S8 [Candidatus Pacearchaeota archaeon]
MSQDIISDALNQMMNAKKAGKKEVVLTRRSKLLEEVLDLAKEDGYIENYEINGNKLKVIIGKIIECKSIKPRFNVNADSINKYMRRYLPGIGLGVMIISTNEGVMTHNKALEKKIGGSLLAYFY